MGETGKIISLTDTQILASSLKVGALSGIGGFTYGGVSSILRASPHPVVRSISFSIYWFTCGSSFWWIRSNIINLHFENNAAPHERSYTSALSSGIAGGGVTRLMGGRLIPGVVIFSTLGFLGQASWNKLEKWQEANIDRPSKPFLQRLADSKWIPLRSLSDDDFRNLLNEKLLNIETDIAMIDEKIKQLQQARMEEDVLDKETSQRKSQ